MDRDTEGDRIHWILRLKEMSYDDKGDAVIGILVMLGWVFIIVASLLGWFK